MCEVVKSNFKELFPKIEKSLKKAAFIAIDCEFSGLVFHSKLKNSLFDSSSERYLKLKCSIEQFTIFQFGLAIFHYNRDANKYTSEVYSFYTFPCSFGPIDNRFLSQATSWEFLRAHNFNFNKVAYEGVPFMSNTQEKAISDLLGAGSMFSSVERSLSYRDEDLLQEHCSRVAQWLTLAPTGDSLDIDIGDTESCLIYFLHKEIRARFRDVFTFTLPCKIRVKKLSSEEISKAKQAEGDKLDKELLDNLLGFAKVFRLLVALKKPLVGHNLLLDLMILYNQMFEPLPSTYEKFKKQLNILFPSIHDTKFISYRVKDILKKQESWTTNRLDHLYVFFSSSKGQTLASFSPIIAVEGEEHLNNIENHLHEAAWDAFMSGYCFIRLAHFLAITRLGKDALPRALSRVEHLSAVSEFRNCINVIRANVPYMNIGGEDPPSTRPRLLLVTRRDKKPINLDHVAEQMTPLSSSSIDIKEYSICSALVAVPNHPSVRDIVRAFIKDKEYRVVPFSRLKHSPFVSTLLWSGVIFSGSLCLAALLTKSFLRQ